MIKFDVSQRLLVLRYESEGLAEPGWVRRRFEAGDSINLRRRCFTFTNHDLLEPYDFEHDSEDGSDNLELGDDQTEYAFLFGSLEGEYFRLKSTVLGTRNAFFIHRDMHLSTKLFIAERDISILRRIDRLVSEPVYIGGTREGCIPAESYQTLLRAFPTSTELRRYADARVASCVQDHLDTTTDAELAYNTYMNRRIEASQSELLPLFAASELAKYRTLLGRLQSMLTSEANYSEAQWQQEILSIIQLLYPKYIRVFENVRIRDPVNSTHRILDLMLVDACGHVDLIEIKKPFDKSALSHREYRGNFIPARELSGSVMQLEKYIYYLTKWGNSGEEALSKRYEKDLPPGLTLKIVNPKGFIVLGRECGMSHRQRADFEIVKRKFKSVIDIISYDDLLARLQVTGDRFALFADGGMATEDVTSSWPP